MSGYFVLHCAPKLLLSASFSRFVNQR
jgi:hypothetical protein